MLSRFTAEDIHAASKDAVKLRAYDGAVNVHDAGISQKHIDELFLVTPLRSTSSLLRETGTSLPGMSLPGMALPGMYMHKFAL